MTIYLTSDTHYGHQNILKYCDRPFKTIEEMNNELIKRYNEIVTNNDIVWHLGDFSMRFEVMVDILPKLNGVKVLLAGNHDACHPDFKFKRNARSVEDYLDAGWDKVFIQDVVTKINIDGKDEKLVLSHYPRATNEGFVFHGHVHNEFKTKNFNINVGVDQWDFRPISIDLIRSVCRQLKLNSLK